MEWLNFIATELHKGFGPLWKPNTPAEYKTIVVEALGKRFDYLAPVLAAQPYLTGERFTIADAYLFTILNWAKILKVDLAPLAVARAVRRARRRASARAGRAARRASAEGRGVMRPAHALPVARLADAGRRAGCGRSRVAGARHRAAACRARSSSPRPIGRPRCRWPPAARSRRPSTTSAAFRRALYEIRYPAPGAPTLAARITGC